MNVKFISHTDIDKDLYDNSILNSKAGTVYAMSWYLDICSPGWNLLMTDNYRQVMPLPEKKKFGFKYLTQPYFCQQLGVFGIDDIDKSMFYEFINKIPYRYYRLQLNSSNSSYFTEKDLLPNYILELSNNYQQISGNYNTNCKRNLKKSIKHQLEICKINPDAFVSFLLNNTSGIYNDDMTSILKDIIAFGLKNKNVDIIAAYSDSKIIAAVLLLFFKNKIYYLTPVSSEEGKQKQAMTFIVDHLIRENCNTYKAIDFEGSSLSGVAKFYDGFGSEPEYYPAFKRLNIF